MSWVDAHLFKFTLHLRHYWLDYEKAEKVSLKFWPFLYPMVLQVLIVIPRFRIHVEKPCLFQWKLSHYSNRMIWIKSIFLSQKLNMKSKLTLKGNMLSLHWLFLAKYFTHIHLSSLCLPYKLYIPKLEGRITNCAYVGR